jgi:hypothetical protein
LVAKFRQRLKWLYADDPVLGAGMLLLVLYYVCTRGVFQGKFSGDGLFGFEYLRGIVFERTLDMQKLMPETLPFFSIDRVTHHMPNRNPIGPVVAWLPFYLIGCAFLPLFRRLHWVDQSIKPVFIGPAGHGAAPMLAWFAGLGTLAMVLAGYRQTYVLLERRLGRDAARLGATLAVWATPIAWYAVTQPMYQHGCAFGFAVLLVERWDATLGSTQWTRFVWLGVLAGLGAATRAQEVLFLALPGGEVAYRLVKGPSRPRWLVGGAITLAATFVTFLPQLLVWRYYTGRFAPPQVEPLRWGTPMIGVALFSTRSGLFPWSPIAYAAVAGLVVAATKKARARALVWGLFGVFLLDLYVVSCAWVLSGGYGYGARRLSDCALFLAVAVAVLFDRLGRVGRRILVGYACFCVALCLFTMEMQRSGRAPSSGGYARTAARYLEQVRAPKALSRFFERVGYPFVQPVGWGFALWHHAHVDSWEGTAGNFQLDRDGQWFTLLPDGRTLPLDWDHRPQLLDGITVAPGAKEAVVTGKGRILVSMFDRERMTLIVEGRIPDGPVAVTWNGAPAPAERNAEGLGIALPASAVSPGINELGLDLPPGSHLRSLKFVGFVSDRLTRQRAD